MLRILFAIASLLLLSGCVSSPVKLGEFTRSEALDEPTVGETVTRSLGETLVAKGVRTVGPALEVLETTQFNKADGEKSIMTCAVTVMAGTYFQRGKYARNDIDADCFGPATFQITLSDGATNWNCPGQMGIGDVCRDSSGRFFVALAAVRAYLEQDFDNLQVTEKAVERKPNHVEELIYNGRVGNSVKFLYREFANDIARPAFAQELQYDLAESTVIGFKSLRLEVVDANNTEITYRLISTF